VPEASARRPPAGAAGRILQEAREASSDLRHPITEREPIVSDMQTLSIAVEKGQRAEARQLTQALLDAGTRPLDIVEQGLVPGMTAIGEKFRCNEVFVPEMLVAAGAMKECMKLLEPLLAKGGIKPKHTVVLGTVQGDLHDIGKNLVAMMWRGANIHVVDLGTNVRPARFVEAVREHGAQAVGLSALLTTTMPAMKTAVDALRSADLPVKIIVGGAPVTAEYAREIGADGYGPDAASAADVLLHMLGD
jgi:5-methyltetrahydrofolate--homocysteine methyltransferase